MTKALFKKSADTNKALFNKGQTVSIHGSAYNSSHKTRTLISRQSRMVFKKVYTRVRVDSDYYNIDEQFVALLEIPAGTLIRHGFTVADKHRAAGAKVIAFYDKAGKKVTKHKTLYSGHDRKFAYTIGKTIAPKEPFNLAAGQECGSGIHFFYDFASAKNW